MASTEIHSISPTTATTTTTTTTTAKSISPEEIATYLNDSRFNCTFHLPADPSRGRPEPFQVSYADFGFHREDVGPGDGNQEQALLFFGPLMSSRLLNVVKDELAKKYKVRIVTAERPGIGRTDSVPAEKMLEIWREAIPALLNHLNIKHVSVACHSGGTIYGLDFAIHNPQFLHPSRPYIALGAPWVHPSHSGVLMWSLASSLPRSVVAQTDKLATFVNSTLAPSLGVSATISGSVKQIWSSEKKPKGREGPDVEFEEGLRSRLFEHIFADSVRGIGQEVQVLLRNGVEKDGWSDWGDVDVLAPRLAEAVRNVYGVKLKMDIFFAEKDVMIGDAGGKGTNWLDACWRDVDGVEFTSETIKDSDHDGLWDLRWDVMERVFQTMTQD